MSAARLPAHLEVSALLRGAESAGGFGTVIAKGERDAGTILIVTMERGANSRVWERLPAADGTRNYRVTQTEDIEKQGQIQDYLARRAHRDPDLWVIELDIADAERFIAEAAN